MPCPPPPGRVRSIGRIVFSVIDARSAQRRGRSLGSAAFALAIALAGCAGPHAGLVGAPLAPASAVQGRTPIYTLTPPTDVWHRVPLAATAPHDLDLTLAFREAGAEGFVKVWVYPAGDRNLAALASQRRALIFLTSTVDQYEERRSFLSDSKEIVPVADARFTVRSKAGKKGWVVVRTLETRRHLIEALGMATGSPSAATEVDRLLQSLEPLEGKRGGTTPR